MIEPQQLTQDFLKALLDWQGMGHRCVTIKIEPDSLFETSDGPNISVWSYDYDMAEGLFIKTEKELPTREELEAAKMANIEREREELIKRLERLEG